MHASSTPCLGRVLVVALAVCSLAAPASPTATATATPKVHVVLDFAGLDAKATNATRLLHRPRKDARNPVLVETEPWEDRLHMFGSVVQLNVSGIHDTLLLIACPSLCPRSFGAVLPLALPLRLPTFLGVRDSSTWLPGRFTRVRDAWTVPACAVPASGHPHPPLLPRGRRVRPVQLHGRVARRRRHLHQALPRPRRLGRRREPVRIKGQQHYFQVLSRHTVVCRMGLRARAAQRS